MGNDEYEVKVTRQALECRFSAQAAHQTSAYISR